MKIVSTGSTLASPEFHKKKLKERKRRLYLSITIIVALLAGLIVLARQERFLIGEVSVEGAKTVTEESIEREVKERLAGSYLGLVPRANFLVYPRDALKAELMREFSRFSSVALDVEGANALKVAVAEREPYALYCPSAGSPEDAAECYFIDDSGYIFDLAPAFSGTVYFIYALEEPFAEPLGNSFLSPEEFRPLAKFVSSLPELGIEPLSLEAGASEYRILLPGGALMLLDRSSDLSIVGNNIKVFLESEAIRNEKDFFPRLSLLDLRTENKVFYRFK